MIFLSRASNRTQLLKKTLLALAVLGLAFPGSSTAQQFSRPSAEATSRVSGTQSVLEEGSYFFGQSPEREQIGSAYAVLSVQGNQTIGAFYYPYSSFDCFSGEVLPNRLALNVVDSYEQTTHPYSIALTLEDSLVAGEAAGLFTLEGFHRIEEIGASEHNILAVCQADLTQ